MRKALGAAIPFIIAAGLEVSPIQDWRLTGAAWILAIILAAIAWGPDAWRSLPWRQDRRAQTPKEAHEALARKLGGWLHDRHGYELIDTEVRDDGFTLVTRFEARTIQLDAKDSEPGRLLVSCGIQLNANHQGLIDNAAPPERQPLLDNLVNRLVLNVMPIGVQVGMRREEGRYRIKLVTDLMMRNDFDEYTLLQAIGVVTRAHATVNATLITWAEELPGRASSRYETGRSVSDETAKQADA